MIKAVIVDDEPKAIQSLIWELSNFSEDIVVVKTFTSPEEAIDYLDTGELDCLFLDIQMPTMDGFQFLEKLTNKDFAVVITTAYNEFAIKALKHDAIDYLLKPIDSDDLEEALKKVDATKHWKDVFSAYNRFSSEPVDTDINSYVTQKALDGIFYYVAQEEINIRKNPAGRVTDVLRSVFGK